MHRLAAVTLVFLSQACAIERSIVSQPYHPLEEPALEARWTLSDMNVSPPNNPELGNQRFTAMLQQIEGHMRQALSTEPALGQHVEGSKQAQYAVEVDVRLVEAGGINGFYGVGLGADFLPAAGAIAGLVATTGPASAGLALLGAGVGGLIAGSINLMVPQHTQQGQLEATVRVRRAADGVEVAQRTCRSNWSVDINAFAREEKLALAAGDAVPELEHEVAKSLRGVFTALDAPPGQSGAPTAEVPEQEGGQAAFLR